MYSIPCTVTSGTTSFLRIYGITVFPLQKCHSNLYISPLRNNRTTIPVKFALTTIFSFSCATNLAWQIFTRLETPIFHYRLASRKYWQRKIELFSKRLNCSPFNRERERYAYFQYIYRWQVKWLLSIKRSAGPGFFLSEFDAISRDETNQRAQSLTFVDFSIIKRWK